MIGGVSVSPHGVAQSRFGIALQCGLSEQAADKSRKKIATAALREVRIAGAIHENGTGSTADQCVVAFQDDPAIGEAFREGAQRGGAVDLDFGAGGFEEARRFAGVRRDDADEFFVERAGFKPIEGAGIHDQRFGQRSPKLLDGGFEFFGKGRRSQAGTGDERGTDFFQPNGGRPGMDHGGLQLAGDGLVSFGLSANSDETGLGALGAPRGEDGGAVIAEAAGENHYVAVSAFVAFQSAVGKKTSEIVRIAPTQFCSLDWAWD